MEIVRRIHNPRNQTCGCDPDCWCNRTALGRAVKWWLPNGTFGLWHKAGALRAENPAEWKRDRQDES